MFLITKKSLVFGLTFSLLLFAGCKEEKTVKKTPVEEEIRQVKVHTLHKTTYPIWATFPGKTEAVDKVTILSRVKGELQQKHFEPGDKVKKGQLLFSIDKSEYQAIWDKSNALLQKDKASLNLAKANVKRYLPLVKEQLAPREKLDELMATQKQLEASIRADEAALKSAKLNLEYCDVKATITGEIGRELVLVGNLVTEGTELVKIVQSDFLYVNFNPSANEVAVMQQYKSKRFPEVRVSLKKASQALHELKGHIDFMDSVANASTGTVPIRAKVTNPNKIIFPGSFVEVKVLISEHIPVTAVNPDQIYQNQQGQYF